MTKRRFIDPNAFKDGAGSTDEPERAGALYYLGFALVCIVVAILYAVVA